MITVRAGGADAGGPYSVDEGSSIVLDASASSDPDQATATLTFEWDYDGDGQFDDATGPTPTYSAAGLDGPETVTVRLRVTDDQGVEDITTASIQIDNVIPVITSLASDATFASKAEPLQTVTVNGSFTDAGVPDTHTAEIDWGDGTVEALSVDQLADALSGGHEYATGGIFTITVTVTDDDGGESLVATTEAVVTGVGVIDRTLYIVGTEGRDQVKLKFNEKKDEVKVDVKLNQGGSEGGSDAGSDGGSDGASDGDRIKQTIPLSSIDRTVAYLCGGDDHYDGGSDGGSDRGSDGAADAAIPQFVFGGAGDDHLRGGRGNDVLSGGTGDDDLQGRSGLDILIGGLGRDKLKGGRDDDLLIGGSVANENNLDAVDAALTKWVSGDLAAALWELGAHTDDEEEDTLKGQQGDNYLLGGVGDKVKP